jgi:hypothetical protein
MLIAIGLRYRSAYRTQGLHPPSDQPGSRSMALEEFAIRVLCSPLLHHPGPASARGDGIRG